MIVDFGSKQPKFQTQYLTGIDNPIKQEKSVYLFFEHIISVCENNGIPKTSEMLTPLEKCLINCVNDCFKFNTNKIALKQHRMTPEHVDDDIISLGSEEPLKYLLNDEIIQMAGIGEFDYSNGVAISKWIENVYIHPSLILQYPTNDYSQQNIIFASKNVPIHDSTTINQESFLFDHYVVCANCKEKSETNTLWSEQIGDTGASIYVTNDINDFIEYELIIPMFISTTKKAQGEIYAIGQGAIVVNHIVETKNNKLIKVMSCFYPIFYVPGLHKCLFFIGTMIQMGFECRGTRNSIALYKGDIQQIHFTPVDENGSIFILQTQRAKTVTLQVLSTIQGVNYELMHQ